MVSGQEARLREIMQATRRVLDGDPEIEVVEIRVDRMETE